MVEMSTNYMMTSLLNWPSREISNPNLHKESTKVLIFLTKLLHKVALNLHFQLLYEICFIQNKFWIGDNTEDYIVVC